VGVSSDQVSRDADVTSWADSDFQDTCGQAIVPDLPYGIANFVSNVMLKPAESLLTKQDPAAANLLGQLAVPGNIHVVFDSTQVMDHGRVSTTRPIPISSVVVPQLFVPGSAQVASELGVSKSDVTVDTATNMCLFTPNAVGDQTAIAGGGQ
jgi:hypothetical protein